MTQWNEPHPYLRRFYELYGEALSEIAKATALFDADGETERADYLREAYDRSYKFDSYVSMADDPPELDMGNEETE